MSSSDSDDNDIPETNECDRLCKSFAEITGTDEACAQFYLQDRKWNLERSVNDYFESNKKAANGNGKIKSDLVVVLNRNKTGVTAATSAFFGEPYLSPEPKKRKTTSSCSIDGLSSPLDSNVLKCIVWNIDGLSDKNSVLRMKAVTKIILQEDADIVFLQEVIPPFAEYFVEALKNYDYLFGNDDNYFNGTLWKKSKFRMKKLKTIFFENTVMGRHFLHIEGCLSNSIPITLMNTHLESTADHADARKVQLNFLLDKMRSIPSDSTVICGGDMNLRDKELDSVGGIPNGIVDVWTACGSRKEVQYTWDMTRNDNLIFEGKFKPRMRFDRIFFKPSSPPQLKPVYFGLIGLERLTPHRCFPSDHWGLLCHYEIIQSK